MEPRTDKPLQILHWVERTRRDLQADIRNTLTYTLIPESDRGGYAEEASASIIELWLAQAMFLHEYNTQPIPKDLRSVRNFIAHGSVQLYRGSRPYARLVNSPEIDTSFTWTKDGYPTEKDKKSAAAHLDTYPKSLSLLRSVKNAASRDFVKKHAPSQTEDDLTGLTGVEVVNLARGLLLRRQEWLKARS